MQNKAENIVAYIVDGIGRFVNSTVQQFGDAKLLYVASYVIGGSAQDVIRLKKEKESKSYHSTIL